MWTYSITYKCKPCYSQKKTKNDNLEQQAQAIYRSWFVDFEPFKRGKFVDSELGEIPEGWRVGKLSDVTILFAGGDKPENVSSVRTDSHSIPIYSNGLENKGLYGFTSKAKVFEESVTVSARGTIGFVCLREEPFVPIVRLVTVIPIKEILTAKYLFQWLSSIYIGGTGTTQQQLTVPDFKRTKILLPPKGIIQEYSQIVAPFYMKLQDNNGENDILSHLRDILLPKLMSGELKISDLNS